MRFQRLIVFVLMATALLSGPTLASAQETALEALREHARQNRSDAEAQSAYGMGLLRAGRYREAERALQTAARLSRRSPEALFDVARVAFAQGDYRRARSACQRLGQPGAGSALSRTCHARAFLVWNRSARAFEELEAALAAEPDNFEALLALGDAHRLRAALAEAESAYRRAAAARPQSAEPHVGLGRLYAAARRKDDAIAALRLALSMDDASPDIEYELGQLLGGTDEARQLLGRAAAGRPNWAEAQIALGEGLLAAGENERAKAAFEEAMRLNDQLAEAHNGVGRALAALGQHEAAEAALRRALELVPNDSIAMLGLANLFRDAERYEEAFEHYRRAADLGGSNPRPLLFAAKLALHLRRDVLAAGFLDRLLEPRPNLAPALVLYGHVMQQRRNYPHAIQYYQRALAGEGDINRARVEQTIGELSRRRPQRRRRSRRIP